MAAALREFLVLELDRVRARALEQAHGAADIERVAVTCISVNDQIGVDPIADHADDSDDLVHAHETDVRPAEPGIGDRRAGDVERREAGLFGDERGERVVNARSDDDRLAIEALSQLYEVGHRYNPR